VLSAFVELAVTHPDEIPKCVEKANCPVGFAFAAGTSMAAPHVSGVAGLVRDEDPRLGSNRVATRLKQTAESLGDRQRFGHGMVDAHAAVSR
jgi:subtilisin family serine protease